MAGGKKIGGHKEAAKVRIIAASDVVRAGLESLVAHEPRFVLDGSAGTLNDTEAGPGIVLCDVERLGGDALSALHAAIEEDEADQKAFPSYVLIGGEGDEAIKEAFRAGIVRALLPRTASGDEILAALEAVAAGLIVIDENLLPALLSPENATADEAPDVPPAAEKGTQTEPPLENLTPREREVLEMLAEGLANKEIAWRLKISDHTVKFHVASIFAKLGVTTRTEAVMQGVRRGLVLI